MNIEKELAVIVEVSEPWDWQDVVQPNPLTAKIIKWHKDDYANTIKFMMLLDQAVIYSGSNCRYFICSPRHEGVNANDVLGGNKLLCSLVNISDDRANSIEAFDLSLWRGGVALIASVQRAFPASVRE